MSTSFLTKCEILADVYVESLNTEDKDMIYFREINDIGLPMAYLSNEKLIEIKEEGKKYIEESWIELCKALNVDPEKEYANADDILNESPLGKEDE